MPIKNRSFICSSGCPTEHSEQQALIRNDIMNTDYYIPHLEWEAINFPLTIRNIQFEITKHSFDKDVTITIWRENYNILGKITGIIKNPKDLEQHTFLSKGNVIQDEKITGDDSFGNSINLFGCIIGGFTLNSWQSNEIGYFFEAELILDKAKIKFIKKESDENVHLVKFHWFVCNKTSTPFRNTTLRNLNLPVKKIRIGVDDYVESTQNFVGSSFSKDYNFVDTPDIKCIISKVPELFLPKNMTGICFELRNEFSGKKHEELLNSLKNLVSFLLGTKLYPIGYSFVEGGFLTESYLESADIDSKLFEKSTLPPIRYNIRYNWESIINVLFPKYLCIEESLKLNYALDKYFLAQSIPLGSNIPILSNVVETIADNYLKTTDCKLEYISKDDYYKLIKDEIDQIKIKLSSLDGGQIILNKILVAYRKGPNEKMTHFFEVIGIKIDKQEKEALNLRNKVIHGRRDYNNDNILYDDLILSWKYLVLFNRIILSLLGYQGNYIDYSLRGAPFANM